MKSPKNSQIKSVLVICLLTILTFSTTSKALEIPVGLDVRRLFTVDINYDGLDDLVVGGTDGVAILIADGRGGFEPPDPLSGAGLVGVADTNEDGFLDIITTTAVIFGSSGGKWSIGPTHIWVDNVGGEVADFDNDGHIDFIAARSYDYYIFYGDGIGNFVRDTKSDLIGEFLVAQDVNSDTLPDMVRGSHMGGVFVFLNLGQRQWSQYTFYPFPLPAGRTDNVYRPAVADFTGDGVIDIVAGGHGYGKIYLLEGKGGGTFKGARSIADFAHVDQLSVADFDKDGLPDVLASGYSTNLVMILYGDPAGQFARQTVVPLGSSHIDAATGDYDSDGWQDIAVLSWTTDTVSILYNDGKGSFDVPPFFHEDAHVELAADFDRDGNKDILLTRSVNNEKHLFLSYGKADGTFEGKQQLSHKPLPQRPGPGAFVVGYFDERLDASQDIETYGRLDVGFVGLSDWDSRLYVVLNRVGRVWSQPISAARNNGDEMVAGDFNEDGYQDIVSTPFILFGNGNGTFQTTTLGLKSAVVVALPRAMTDDIGQSALDLDNDGHLDIVAIQDSFKPGRWIGWGKGDGSFDFVWDERVLERRGPLGTWLADINGDDLPDIVDVDRVWLNLGNRSFCTALDFGGEPVDINGDGTLDLIKTYWEEGCLEVRLSDGHFGWSYPELWIHGGQLSRVNIFYGPPDDPVSNVLVGRYYYGFWTHSNPWRGVSVSDTYGPRILDYVGPLNPGFTIAPTEFVLRLSEPIQPATVNSDSVYLASAGADRLLGSSDDIRMSGSGNYDQAKWQITFIPDGPLHEGPYRFVVSGQGNSAICDLAGNALDGTVFDGFPSGNDTPGGSFITTFYVVDSLPEPQALDSRQEDISGEPTSPKLIALDSNRRATITGDMKPLNDRDCYFLGELRRGDVVTVDLDGLGAGLTLAGGAVSILRHLPQGWVAYASQCLTDGFVDSHLSFPIRHSGEYVLEVNSYSSKSGITIYQMNGTYSIDVAIETPFDPWGTLPSPQTVFLDFGVSENTPWGHVEPFDAGQLDLDSARTGELVASIVDKVKKDFTQFSNIVITSNQPAGVDYSRVSVGLAWWIVDPDVDDWNLNYSDEGLVNSYSFWEMRHYGLDAVAQAMANTISHQAGHLLGLQHAVSYRGLMNDVRGAAYWTQDQSFGKGRYWWCSTYPGPDQDDAHILEYNTGPTLPTPISPTVGSLTADPNSVKRGETFLLYAQNVSDVDGRIIKVEFYHDRNVNSLLEIGVDEYLSSSLKRWMSTLGTSSYSVGVHGFLARAMDDDGAWSNVVSTTVTINEP